MIAHKKVLLLIGSGQSPRFLYHAIKEEINITAVGMEERPSRLQLLKGRIRRLGYGKVLGQLLFMLLVPRVLTTMSRERIKSLHALYGFNQDPIPEDLLHSFISVNSKACYNFLVEQQPDLVLILGTRIISERILQSIDAPFVNIHAGITPAYRGVHGGYWALANGDIENAGVSVHLVDRGIDTGAILYQEKITVESQDNFVTYPILQLGKGIELLKRASTDFSKGSFKIKDPVSKKSKLWYHPTLYFYLKTLLTRGVK